MCRLLKPTSSQPHERVDSTIFCNANTFLHTILFAGCHSTLRRTDYDSPRTEIGVEKLICITIDRTVDAPVQPTGG